jgi:hypothetical protein
MSIAWTNYRPAFAVPVILCKLKFQVADGNRDLRIAIGLEGV